MKVNRDLYSMRMEKPTIHPEHMRKLALQELTVKRGNTKERAKRSLRIMLPAWLSVRTTRAFEQTSKNMQETNGKE